MALTNRDIYFPLFILTVQTWTFIKKSLHSLLIVVKMFTTFGFKCLLVNLLRNILRIFLRNSWENLGNISQELVLENFSLEIPKNLHKFGQHFLRLFSREIPWNWLREIPWNGIQEISRNMLREIPWNCLQDFDRIYLRKIPWIFRRFLGKISRNFRGFSAKLLPG